MEKDDAEHRAADEYYRKLAPEERRGRFFLQGAYRDAYNAITRADRIASVVPAYFFEKWAPVLGPVVSMVYLRLRQYTYRNVATGEERVECWPKQSTIAREIGVRNRKTVAAALEVLEESGFIKREAVFRPQARADGAMQRGADKYWVWFELPLVPEDAIELLLRKMGEQGLERPAESMSEERTQTPGRGEDPGSMSEPGTQSAVRQTDSRTSTRTSTLTLTNVGSGAHKKDRLRDHPTVAAMSVEERERRSALALELGERLKTWGGGFDGSRHESEGFHRRVAFLMPEPLVRQALSSTHDALAQRIGGREGLRSDPSRYFGGAVKRLALEHGIDLGLTPGPRRRVAGPNPEPPSARPPPEPEPSPEERAKVRELLAGLIASLEHKRP
jgi:hypothetical protein